MRQGLDYDNDDDVHKLSFVLLDAVYTSQVNPVSQPSCILSWLHFQVIKLSTGISPKNKLTKKKLCQKVMKGQPKPWRPICLSDIEFLEIYDKMSCNKRLLKRQGVKNRRWSFTFDLVFLGFDLLGDRWVFIFHFS